MDGPGAYELVITDIQGCSASSESIVTTMLEYPKTPPVLYPNPCVSPCVLHGFAHSGEEVLISDLQGRLVMVREVSGQGTLDLQALGSGTYLMHGSSLRRQIVRLE